MLLLWSASTLSVANKHTQKQTTNQPTNQPDSTDLNKSKNTPPKEINLYVSTAFFFFFFFFVFEFLSC
jgi:ABC-type Na+ efflux pump permease subunit